MLIIFVAGMIFLVLTVKTWLSVMTSQCPGWSQAAIDEYYIMVNRKKTMFFIYLVLAYILLRIGLGM